MLPIIRYMSDGAPISLDFRAEQSVYRRVNMSGPMHPYIRR
jgi:hypothetical protein